MQPPRFFKRHKWAAFLLQLPFELMHRLLTELFWPERVHQQRTREDLRKLLQELTREG